MPDIHNRLVQFTVILAICSGLGLLYFVKIDGFRKKSPDAGNQLALNELQVAKRQADVCSSRNAKGVGLRGEYFAETGFKGKPVLSRIDATVDFDLTVEWRSEQSSPVPRSVRWRGWVRPPMTGRYLFHAGNDDAIVIVSKQAVAGRGAPADSSIELAAGRYYPIVVEVHNIQTQRDGQIRLEWTAPHGMRFVVPRALLFLPSETAS
jgi:hypothetical protein